MRVRTPRRLAAVALSTALVLGSAGTTMAADFPHQRPVRAEAPVPGADAVLAQVKTLGDLGGAITPVTDLLTAVLKADNGQLPAADLQSQVAKITTALDKLKSAVPAAPALPTPPAPALPAPPYPSSGGSETSAAPLDIRDDAVAALKKAIDTLVKDVTTLNVAGLVPHATAVVTGLVGVVVATVLGGGLPAPSLPGLPPLPKPPV
ncbi:hypothetical protein AB0451_29915 [Streptomyces sp. NPDC052000]|uniref:hypothetical protein n=1 Tax=Streptomyces sp. NPDC052000 TaxID=3155676 RepID=UPI00344FF5DE